MVQIMFDVGLLTKFFCLFFVQIKLFVGLYHGNEALCAVQETDELSVQDGCCNVKVDLTLPAVVADVPRSARLCFSVCAAVTIKKKNARVCTVFFIAFCFIFNSP